MTDTLRIKCVTFDLDNTLWDVDPVIIEAEKLMRRWLKEKVPGIETRFDPEIITPIRESIIAASPELIHDLSELRIQLLHRLISGCGMDEEQAGVLARDGFEIFLEARHRVAFYPSVHEVLEELAGAYMLGSLTNGNADINRLPIRHFFSFNHSSASVGIGKPNPDMFHAALQSAACAPEEMVHVGDHLRDDIAGAASVGLHTVWVNLREQQLTDADTEPTRTVTALAELPEVIAKMARQQHHP